jgi:hypothetical protein
MKRFHPHRRVAEAGLALLEILGALAIGAMLIVGLMGMIDSSIDDAKGRQAAFYQSQMVDATRRYIGASFADVNTLTAGGGTVALTPAELQTAGFLPAGYAATNSYGQRICALMRQPDPAGFPGRIDVVIVSTGGAKIGDKDVAMVAMSGGAGSGYITSANPTQARGAAWAMDTGVWRGTPCGGGALLTGGDTDGGHLVSNLFFDGPGSTSDFLYRNEIPNRPELNRLNTALRFGENGIVDIDSSCLDGNGLATEGLAIERTTRSILSCDQLTSTWIVPDASPWKQGVATYAALPAGGNDVGDVRMALDIGRAFMFTGAGWQALAEDQNGDMALRRDLVVTGNATTTGSINSGGSMTAAGTISTAADLNVGTTLLVGTDATIGNLATGGGNLQVNGTTVSTGRITSDSDIIADILIAAPELVMTRVFVHGAACHIPSGDMWIDPTGAIAMDANYRPLVCSINHVWTYADGS